MRCGGELCMKDIKSKLKCAARGSVTACGIDRPVVAVVVLGSFDLARQASHLSYPAIVDGPYAHEYRVLLLPRPIERPTDRPISEFDRHLPKFGHVFHSPSSRLFPSLRQGQRPTDDQHFRETILDAGHSLMPILHSVPLLRYSRDDSLSPLSLFSVVIE